MFIIIAKLERVGTEGGPEVGYGCQYTWETYWLF